MSGFARRLLIAFALLGLCASIAAAWLQSTINCNPDNTT
jgi:hypothetical protein